MKKKVIFAVVFLFLMVAIALSIHRSVDRRTFSYSAAAVGNPLMGYAPSAQESDLSDDISLLYVEVTWRELEPEKGIYRWDAIEKANQFKKWRAEGKHFVLRFVLDYPGEKQHKDIPDWLYDELADPGDWYDSSYGKGFSPNYHDKKLVSYYQKAVKALGERWGQDSFISYIELGGLGHWGEWHVNLEAGIRPLPNDSIREQYVTPWLTAFPEASFLMRRPFSTAKKYGFGIYNDMAGDAASTQEWLDWIKLGGIYDQTNEKSLTAMPDSWKTAPIGGELTSSLPMEQLLVSDLQQTVDLVKTSHTSFLGPKIAEAVDGDKKGYDKLLQHMGYRLWISSAKLQRYGGTIKLITTWENAGVAPFYKNWKVYVYVQDDSGTEIEKTELPIELPKLLPGEQVTVAVNLSKLKSAEAVWQKYQISVGIVDPMTGENAVHFAVAGQENQKRLILFTKNWDAG